MDQKIGRFQKLEYSSLLKIFKRARPKLKRFELLEIDGHKIKIRITEVAPQEGLIVCPECKYKNPKNSLSCGLCGKVFRVSTDEVKEERLEGWQVRCPGCGKIATRTQKNCLYCGWRLLPWQKEEMIPWDRSAQYEKEFLRQGELITLTIDGKTYRSTDDIIPEEIRGLMLKIQREGYSKEMIDAWVKAKNIEKDLGQQENKQLVTRLKWQVFWRALQVIFILILAFILIYYFRLI